MIHPAFQGMTKSGDNTKENVARFLAGGHILDSEGWIFGPAVNPDPIPEAFTQAQIEPHGFILHSNAAPAYTKIQALIAYWRRADITGEAHFQIDLNGSGKQAIPLGRKADCNFKANRFFKDGAWRGFISFETSDLGAKALPGTVWPVDQMGTMCNIMFLACVAYNLPCSACPTAYSKGIDYHSKFPEWSNVTGKTCPGAARIRQMDQVRIEVANRLAEYYRQCGGNCPGTG